MGRRKKDKEKVVTSIYVDKDLKDVADLCDVSDSDLWMNGLKATLQANGSQEALKKLLNIYIIERDDLQRKIDIIQQKIIDKVGKIWVRDKGDDCEYPIEPSQFDPDKHVKTRE
jgi:hypothetical protein